jgi:hypothetical protein
MNARHTAFWLSLATCLFAFIFFYQRHVRQPSGGPERVLPALKLANVTAVQVRPSGKGQTEEAILAERTNNTWRLVKPKAYPAQAAGIEDLLAALEELTAAFHIPEPELRKHPKADEDSGFASPQASLIIWQGNQRTIVHVGARTSPGDQVYLEVVGSEGAFVVDATLLKHIPRSVNDWRDTTFFSLDRFNFDRIAITNNTASLVTMLQRDTNSQLWRMVWPLRVRADSARIEDSLHQLQNLRIGQFVSDDAKPDLEAFGLAPPDFELVLGDGTNTTVAFHFGKGLTNDATQVYGRRLGESSIFTVSKAAVAPWRASANDNFRDPLLLRITEPVGAMEVVGQESFSLLRQTNGTWRVLPDNFPADSANVEQFLSTAGSLQVSEFVKEVVNPPDLPEYGLAEPLRRYILKSESAGASSNAVLAELDFGLGTNRQDRVYARRTDESSVYAITTNDFARLPSAGWQLRERKLWSIMSNDIARVTIEQKGKVRQLLHKGPYEWSFAPGSQGILPNVLAVEETVRGLAQASSVVWVARGRENCDHFGIRENEYKIVLELKNGEKVAIQFGDPAPSSNTYALVEFAGQPWVLEFPWLLYRDVAGYLSIPAGP